MPSTCAPDHPLPALLARADIPPSRPRRHERRTPLPILVGLFLLSALVGCGDEGESASATGGRDAPAEVPPLWGDVDRGEDVPDDSPEIVDDDPAPDHEPDRILREGVVGEITCVIDGDTVHVTVDGWYHRVRMLGINAPECEKTRQLTSDGMQYLCSADQEYWGLHAGQALTDLALHTQVTVHCDQAPGDPCPTDPFDRFLAYLDTPEWDLSEYMARYGHALAYTSFEDTTRLGAYCEAEAQARAESLGMWAYGSRHDVLELMNENTQDWYRYHDDVCDEVTR